MEPTKQVSPVPATDLHLQQGQGEQCGGAGRQPDQHGVLEQHGQAVGWLYGQPRQHMDDWR